MDLTRQDGRQQHDSIASASRSAPAMKRPVPVLLAVDEDRRVLADVESALRGRYGQDYRVDILGTHEQAIERLVQLARAGDELALVLAGSSAPDVTGTELLERTRQLHPLAKRALMVPSGALADPATAQAIVDSMALGRIDYYVPRPAAAPDEVFHHAISSFLLEWTTERRIVPHTVHLVGETWSGRAYELREVFKRCAAPYVFCLADTPKGRDLLTQAGPEAKLPLMVLPDGRILSDPSNAAIAAAAGAPVEVEDDVFDVVIVGAGPAGLSAAVYAASEGLRALVVDAGGIGGQVRSSSLIRNYLGFPKGVSGSRLAEQAYEQASVFGASFLLMHEVTGLERSGGRLHVSLSGGRRVTAAAVVLATGASYRRLEVPSLEALTGAGVFYGGSSSEAHALTGGDAYVVGGGNSAGQAALHLARHARRVTLVVRGDALRDGMSQYLIRAIGATPNADVRTGTAVVGGGGDGRLEELVLRELSTGDEWTAAADALFVLIGARPNTSWLPADIARDDHGFLHAGDDLGREHGWPLERRPFALETSIPGVLAAGDVRHGSVKRVASAVGEGSLAAKIAHSLLAERMPRRRADEWARAAPEHAHQAARRAA